MIKYDTIIHARGEYLTKVSKGKAAETTLFPVASSLNDSSDGPISPPNDIDINWAIDCRTEPVRTFLVPDPFNKAAEAHFHLHKFVGIGASIDTLALFHEWLEQNREKHRASNLLIGSEIEFRISEIDASQNSNSVNCFNLLSSPITSTLATFWSDVDRFLERNAIDAVTYSSEVGDGIYEISLPPNPPDLAMDQVVFCRFLLRSLGEHHGITVSFDPFSSTDVPSLGLHLSISSKTLSYSELMDRSSSVCGKLGSMMPWYCNSFSALKRIIASNQISPVISIGIDRTHTLRWKEALNCLEFRLPAADCNPYLACVALIEALNERDRGTGHCRLRYDILNDYCNYSKSVNHPLIFPDDFLKLYHTIVHHEIENSVLKCGF